MAKRFALVSFGIFCLILSALIGYHIASEPAVAQVPSNTFVEYAYTADREHYGMTANGDVYWAGQSGGQSQPESPFSRWAFIGNITGGTVPTAPSTMGGVKSQYDKND